MRNEAHIILLAAGLLFSVSHGVARADVPTPAFDPNYRDQLLEIAASDQADRQDLGSLVGTDALEPELKRLAEKGVKHADWLIEQIQQGGFPDYALVGEEGAQAAFMILQHDPRGPSQEVIDAAQAAFDRGQWDGHWIALLRDRHQIAQGLPQIYGTQFKDAGDGTMQLDPIQDPESVDERRAALGLDPLDDELARVSAAFGVPVTR